MSLEARLQNVFRDVFDNDSLVLADDLSQQSFEDWDSFHQVKLAIAIEEEFSVKLSTDDVVAETSVAAIKAGLLRKGIAA